jgi:GntR family transcriptional regulator
MAPTLAPAAPLYLRIQQSLRADIQRGRFPEGARLPSESELAERFRTTRTTVRQALARLTFDGVIVRRMGLGTFVAKPPVEGRIEAQRPQSFEEQMEAAGGKVSFRLVAFDAEPAPALIAETLGLAGDDPVFRLRRLRLVDGEVIGLEDRWMLARLGNRVPAAALATQSAMAMAEVATGAPLGGLAVSVGAETATSELAQLLGLRRGDAVLVRKHTFFDQDGEAILTGESIYRGDKYRFTYRFGATQSKASGE